MNILYIASSFPKPENGATIYTDLAEELHLSNHKLTVLIADQTQSEEDLIFERGFEVLRVYVGKYFEASFIRKGITTIKIPLKLKKAINKNLNKHKFDLILFEAPPVSNIGLVKWCKKKYKCNAFLMLKDIFPQNAIDLGVLSRNGLITRYFRKMEEDLLKNSDYIGCMSKANRNYVLSHNNWLDSSKVGIFPNTKKISGISKIEEESIRVELGIPIDSKVFLFGGNMGKPQFIDLLKETIIHFKDNDNIYFLFVGRGTDKYKLTQAIEEHDITNSKVINNLPREEYEKVMRECDLGLIILDPRFTIPNYPSRILSYLEYAKPILAATDKSSDINELIREADCGEWVWSGDQNSFFNAIENLSTSDRLNEMGLNGRKYMEQNLDVKFSVKIIEEFMQNK